VRLTHWGVAAAILANGVVTREGSDWHIWVGYSAAALLGLRLLWGLIGPAEARFSAFPPSPARALAHVGDIAAGRRTEHRSHNPLGALMVYALWGTLAVVAASGIAMAGPPGVGAAPAAERAAPMTEVMAAERGDDNDDDEAEAGEAAGGEGGEDMLEEVHEAAANLLFILAGLHIAGVLFETRRSGAGVIRAMLPGRRRPQGA
jgi:cytochrome b